MYLRDNSAEYEVGNDPFDVISIHQWEGQSLIGILAPLFLSLVVGFIVLIWKQLVKLNLFNIVGSTAGLLYFGSGLMIFAQMIIALAGAPFNSSVILTIIFMALPLVLGYFLLRKVIRFNGRLSTKHRMIFILFGLGGIFSWSGLIIGPVLATLCGLFPIRIIKNE